jgi:hypothetical protein
MILKHGSNWIRRVEDLAGTEKITHARKASCVVPAFRWDDVTGA